MPDPKITLEEFCVLCEQLWMEHDLYISLFEDNPNLALYNYIATLFFHDLNAILIERLIVQFCRITDPAQTGKHPNLTSNYIFEALPWPAAVATELKAANDRLMTFRKYVEPARNKRVAHADLDAQISSLEILGVFPKGADLQFLNDLQTFVNIVYGHLNNGQVRPIHPAGATDTHQLIRAMQKSVLFDRCTACSDNAKAEAVLDFKITSA